MRKAAVFSVLAAAVLVFSFLFFFPGPIVARLLSRMLGVPAAVEGARWADFGGLAVERIRIAPAQVPEKRLEGVRLEGLPAAVFGSPVRVRIEHLRIGDEDFGQARGRFLWHSGRLVKAQGRIWLSAAGLERVPKKWRKRLSSTHDGPALGIAYAAGKIALRGKNGPILEAAWQPG